MRTIFLLLLLLGGSIVYGQTEPALFYLDNNLQSTSRDSAVIIARRGASDTVFRVNCFLIKTEQLVLSIGYTDSTLQKKHGVLQEYYGNGKMSKQSNYINDIQEGAMLKWNQQGQLTDSAGFEQGQQVSNLHNNYAKDVLANSEFVHQAKNIYREQWYNPEGGISRQAIFTGEKGLVKTFDKNGDLSSADSVFTRKKTNAAFKGGTPAWRLYLERTLNGSVPVKKGAPRGTYTVIIRFIVNKDGSITEIKPQTQLGYGMEEEAMKVLRASPTWVPATEFGLPVKAYRMQPVSFNVI